MLEHLLVLLFAGVTGAAAADPCADLAAATARVVDDKGTLLPVVDQGDVFALLTCADPDAAAVAARFDEAVASLLYAPLCDVAAAAQRLGVEWTPPVACSEDAERYVRLGDVPEPLRKDLLRTYKPSRAPAAASGGAPNIPDHFILSFFVRHANKNGHHQLTKIGADRYGAEATDYLSEPSMALLRDASRDADFFEWGNPSAHAQTENSPATGKLAKSGSQAKTDFLAWERDKLARAAASCRANAPRQALYWVGYALHGVQDLAFHNGISNAEHSWRDYGKTNSSERGVDTAHMFDHKWELAARATHQFLRRTRQYLAAEQQGTCWQKMMTLTAGELTATEKKNLHRRAADMTAAELLKYRRLASTVDENLRRANRSSFLVGRWLVGPAGDFDVDRLDALVASIFAR